MTTEELKTVKVNTRVFNRVEEITLTIVNTVGFTNKGCVYIPCADEKNNIDDYCIEDLITISGKTENIYLNRLKEQYETCQKSILNYSMNLQNYNAMRLFCLDTQLVSFNDIEAMENEINSSF